MSAFRELTECPELTWLELLGRLAIQPIVRAYGRFPSKGARFTRFNRVVRLSQPHDGDDGLPALWAERLRWNQAWDRWDCGAIIEEVRWEYLDYVSFEVRGDPVWHKITTCGVRPDACYERLSHVHTTNNQGGE